MNKRPKPKLRRIDKHGHALKIGDKIRVTGVPPGLRDEDEMLTKTVFEKCVGRVFTIRGFQDNQAELHVGRVMARKSYEESIWVEPEFIELIWTKMKPKAKLRNRRL
jgi:hypothetical protein